jgi:magnesium chelatase subunit H
MVASFDRPEHGARALSRLVAEGLRITGYEQLVQESGTSETKELIDAIVTESVNRFCKGGCEAAVECLLEKANVDREEALATFRLLTKVSEQLDSNHEMESLTRSLRGEYIQPGPGADVVQNPSVLPTGRNTHAVNPYSVPQERLSSERSKLPKRCCVVMWTSMAAIRVPWPWCFGAWTISRRRAKASRRRFGCWVCDPFATL